MIKNKDNTMIAVIVIIILVVLILLLVWWSDYDQQKNADKFCQQQGYKKATDFIEKTTGFGFNDVECDGNIYFTEVCYNGPPDKWGRQSNIPVECKMVKRGGEDK
jgi:hypothetical protein